MVNTYKMSAEPQVKIAEEMRLIRCLLERFLSYQYPQAFLDYQMEKFGKDYKTKEADG